MAEQILAEKFVNYYYPMLAYQPAGLSIIYGEDSVACFHDMDQVGRWCGV